MSFSVWLISLSIITSRSIYTLANGRISFFMAELYSIMCIYVCLCVYLLYSFVCWWTLRIASISWLLSTALVWTLGCIYLFKFVWVFFFFWYIYSGVEWLDHLVVSFFQESPYCFPLWQQLFTFPPTVWRVAFYSHPHQCLWFVIFLIIAFLTGIRWYFIMILICISVMISDIELFFMWLLAICNVVWKMSIRSFNFFVVFRYWIIWAAYIFWISIPY